jgi:IS5 family transposase
MEVGAILSPALQGHQKLVRKREGGRPTWFDFLLRLFSQDLQHRLEGLETNTASTLKVPWRPVLHLLVGHGMPSYDLLLASFFDFCKRSYDGVRVLGRTLAKARAVLQQTAGVGREAVRNRPRSAKRQMKRIMAAARQRGTEAADRMHTASQPLRDIAQATVQPARSTRGAGTHHPGHHAGPAPGRDLGPNGAAGWPGDRADDPTDYAGEAVPASEKIVSLFESHTALIRKGTPGKPTAFGRVIWLDEVAGGSISRYAVLEGNPSEDAQLPPSLDHHRRVFDRPPRVLAGDRGVHSTTNERYATTQGVKQVVLPKPGATSAKRRAHEQQHWFRRGRDWRAGIEGRIRSLKRRHKLDRCRYHGTAGMERWVGWGVIAHNLQVIAQATAT